MKKILVLLMMSLMLVVSGCSSNNQTSTSESNATYSDIEDGTYEGVGAGFAGDIKVSVEIKAGEITAINVLESGETVPDGVEKMPQNIVDNGIEADAISGATGSSEGIRNAVKDAIAKARGEVAEIEVAEGKDVVVVGGGNAGLSAAYWACNGGSSVVLFEKQGKLGGTFGGGTWIAEGSNMQIEQGITNDSTEAFMKDIKRLNQGYIDRTGISDYWFNEDLAIYFGDHMGEVTNFADEIGVDFGERKLGNPTLYEPHDIMRVLSGGNRASYTDALVDALKKFEENGQLQIVMNANVTGLIQEDKAITGVNYEMNGKEYSYNSKAVVLATGGYGYNEDLVARAGLKNYTSSTPSFQTGDGYVWAEEAGAVLKNMDFITTYSAGIKTSETGLTQTYAIRVKELGDIIFVNSDGERFIDEFGPGDGSTYDAITYQWKVQEDNYVYIAVSQSQIDAMKEREQSLLTRDDDWANFEKLLADGEAVFKGATAQEAAEKAGINAENFANTIEKYNGYVDAGKDEDFGRTNITSVKSSTGETVELGRDTFTKLEGDIYLIRTTPYIMICAGGIDVNTLGQALDENREPIPGLYAAGEIVGMANAFGRTTIGGVGNTGAYVWGKMAGDGVNEYIKSLK
ncbi:MAG: FAD-dependent oxidoreductase [Erysipelotrichaceae bacterium]|nr:FAD-dependent oxidoreductase [Erysipelotrichaceae bacterium]